MRKLRILFIEPLMNGSHASVIRNYLLHTKHKIDLLSLDGEHWIKNLCTGAGRLSRHLNQKFPSPVHDIVVATDLFQQGDFYTLQIKRFGNIPKIFLAHEHQFGVPKSGLRYDNDLNVRLSNVISTICADKCIFLSNSSMTQYTENLRTYLSENIAESIERKCKSINLGVDFKSFDKYPFVKNFDQAIILWNHRLEFDKNPEEFFRALNELATEGLDFKVIIASDTSDPNISKEVKEGIGKLGDKIVHQGYVRNKKKLAQLYWKSNIVVSTAEAEFFGLSVAEAIHCNCWPILPKRLTFPQFVPKRFHENHLYTNHKDFVAKLRWAIKNVPCLKNDALQQHVSKYSWDKIAPTWDEAIYRVYDEYRSKMSKNS